MRHHRDGMVELTFGDWLRPFRTIKALTARLHECCAAGRAMREAVETANSRLAHAERALKTSNDARQTAHETIIDLQRELTLCGARRSER